MKRLETLLTEARQIVIQINDNKDKDDICPECSRLQLNPRVLKLQEYEVTSDQGSEEWLEARRECITASDMATVLCKNPYSSRPELLRKKVFNLPFKGNKDAVEHGHAYEPVALKRYEKQTGHKVLSFGLLHKKGSIIGASPDGVTYCGRAVEVKCPLVRKIKPQSVPGHYMPQVQCQLEVMDLDVCDFVQLDTKTDTFDITTVKKEPNWYNSNKNKIEEFSAMLQDCFKDPDKVPQKKQKKAEIIEASTVEWHMDDL